MAEKTDCIVIGAGVVGLAIARHFAMAGREVIILEREDTYGVHTSSRNSGCIHAGINYTPGSLKARLNMRGKELLYQYCPDHGVGHKMIGKLIAIVDEEKIPQLQTLAEKSHAIGLEEIYMADMAEIKELEPNLHCVAALHSPTSGIVDQPELMTAYLGDAEDHGAVLAVNSPVQSGKATENGISLSVGGNDGMEIDCNICINAAGHGATKIAGLIDGVPAETVPTMILARGCYFVLPSKKPFTRMIYPLPDEHDVALHISPDMGGMVRFGPDTEFVDDVEYSVNPDRAPFFYDAARRFWPDIKDGDLEPGYAGVRPKLSRSRAGSNDFVIHGPETHGIPGLVNLFGIESPGLTSSMAIAEYVHTLV
ncbi:MAG: NAD(P)/FAD-dependent oxidoreductase [Rhodospirillaceae bacterium]|nr:NAD(P)/FAD-dependent oxidoreductase [Rhodospirillaceae bacterium]